MVGACTGDGLHAGDAVGFDGGGVAAEDKVAGQRDEGCIAWDGEIFMVKGWIFLKACFGLVVWS